MSKLDKAKTSGFNMARTTAEELRRVVERLEKAVEDQDVEALSEISMSGHVWTVDMIRGFFLALSRTIGNPG